jgi:membrane fusion protein, heavy metal efflux system
MPLQHLCKLFATAALLAFSSLSGVTHEGHDHGPPTDAVVIPAMPRAEAASDSFELVAIAGGGELTMYLDRFATNEPVPNAVIAVETPQGSAEAKRSADGTYRISAPWTNTPGRYDLILSITTEDGADVLTLTVEIPKAAALTSGSPLDFTVPAMAGKDRVATSESSVLIIAILAFIAGAVSGIVLVRWRRHGRPAAVAGALLLTLSSAAHEGEDHAASSGARPAVARDVAQLVADGSVFVPKSMQRILLIRTVVAETAIYRRTIELPGRIIPDPNASGFVQAAVGGRLSPPPGGFPRLGTRVKKGDVLAYVTPPLQAIDVSDMRQRQGELDQQISIVERRLRRYESLAPSGAVPRSQLEDTRLELEGLKERRAALDKVRTEPEALVAPVDGIIADGTPVAGQIAQSNAVIYHIIDPTRLWIEALSYESLPAFVRAAARVGDKELSLVFRGAGFADRNQSIPIHFAIEGDVSGVRVGQFVTVHAETADEQQGLAVPRASLVRSAAGQESVYEHVSAERFVQRPVRVEPLDGQRVLISHGLSAGKRVVVQGAELIDHIR